MTFALRIASLAAALAFAAGAVASAETVELTLTVPLQLKLGPNGPPRAPAPGAGAFAPLASAPGGPARLKAFDVACAVGGANLAYSTATGTAQNAAGQGTSASGGAVAFYDATGKPVSNPTATVILTYDTTLLGPGASGAGATAAVPSSYVCWIAWKVPVNGVAPFFVQGQLVSK